MNNLSFGVISRLAVIDHDPECADFDHPHGEVVGEIYYVGAEDPKGYRWDHSYVSRDVNKIERLAKKIDAAVRAGRKLDMTHWYPSQPAYGSQAYIENEDEIVAADRRHERDHDRDTTAFGY